MTRSALDWSFQKPGSAVEASFLSMAARMAAGSKTPPDVDDVPAKLLDGSDEIVEHGEPPGR